jgi:ribosome-binding factor A
LRAKTKGGPASPRGTAYALPALRPPKRTARFGKLGGVRQWFESIIATLKGQLSLERHGPHTLPGLITRISQRLLALAAAVWHNWNIGDPGRHLTAYDHSTNGITHLGSLTVSERMRRVNESVRAVVAEGVGALKDPRIGMVTVTGVRVTPDLAEATVYFSVLGNEKKRRATLAGLESAHGVLQSRIGRQLNLRRTPTLTFSFDPSVEQGVHMTKLIEDLAAQLPERDDGDDDVDAP